MPVLNARAALCNMRNGELAPYNSKRFSATNEAKTEEKPVKWATAAVGFIVEKT